jgi:DNA repair protein RadC
MMAAYEVRKQEQLELFERGAAGKHPAKRVNIVSVKMVRESSILYPERTVRSPKAAYELVKMFLEGADREHFLVVCLDTKNQPVSITTSHVGSLNSSIVHPREVFKTAVLSNAATVIVAHNHPSGQPEPSREDLEVTKRLCEAGKVLGIEVMDHIIVGDGRFYSLKEKGQM